MFYGTLGRPEGQEKMEVGGASDSILVWSDGARPWW